MPAKRSKKRIDQLKRARGRAGRYVVTSSKSGKIQVRRGAGRAVTNTRTRDGSALATQNRKDDRPQPRPKVPLLSGGKDPTLAERFEEELYRS